MKNIVPIAAVLVAAFLFSCAGGEAVETSAGGGSDGASATEASGVLASGDGPAATPTPKSASGSDSVYSDLKHEKCRNIELDEEGAGWSVDLCKGEFGYDLEVTEGDIRQSINVITPAGKKFELNFPTVVSGAFSTVGDKAEWRFRTVDGKRVPFALIVRFNASEDVENSENVTSYLTVTKITEDRICVTDIVKPTANANVEARKLAETASERPCVERGN